MFFSTSSLTPFLSPLSQPQNRKKDPHCIWNPYIRRWIVTGYQQVREGESGCWRCFLYGSEEKVSHKKQKKTPPHSKKKGIDGSLADPRGGLCERHPGRRRDLDDLSRPFVGRERDPGAHELQCGDAVPARLPFAGIQRELGHHHHQPVCAFGLELLLPRGDDHRDPELGPGQWEPVRVPRFAARAVDEGVAAGDGGAGADGEQALAGERSFFVCFEFLLFSIFAFRFRVFFSLIFISSSSSFPHISLPLSPSLPLSLPLSINRQLATYGSSTLYLTTVSNTNNLASSTAPTTSLQLLPLTISVANPGASPLLSNGVTAFDTVDTRIMSFSVSGTRGFGTLNTAYTGGGLTKMGVAYFFLDIPATGSASTLYNGIFADASYHAWDAGAALNPRNVDVGYFVGVVATVPGFSPVTYPTASFLAAVQRGVGVVSTQALVSGTDGQLLRGFATPKIRSGDYAAACIDPDTGVFW